MQVQATASRLIVLVSLMAGVTLGLCPVIGQDVAFAKVRGNGNGGVNGIGTWVSVPKIQDERGIRL